MKLLAIIGACVVVVVISAGLLDAIMWLIAWLDMRRLNRAEQAAKPHNSAV